MSFLRHESASSSRSALFGRHVCCVPAQTTTKCAEEREFCTSAGVDEWKRFTHRVSATCCSPTNLAHAARGCCQKVAECCQKSTNQLKESGRGLRVVAVGRSVPAVGRSVRGVGRAKRGFGDVPRLWCSGQRPAWRVAAERLETNALCFF